MFDSHCHLDQPLFDHDREDVLARAHAAGVSSILVPGIRPAWWTRQEAVRGVHPKINVHLAIGVHPQIVPELSPDELATATDEVRLAREAGNFRAVAIGECGLDGETASAEAQERIFRAQVRVARGLGLPLVVHVLRAHGRATRILTEERAHEVGGVMHSYSGSVELVRVYADLGFSFSFAGPVTYPKARRPVEAARAVPADRLLAETDAPDQAPTRHRGERSEPAHLVDVIEGLAAARGVPMAEIAALTNANAQRLFKISG